MRRDVSVPRWRVKSSRCPPRVLDRQAPSSGAAPVRTGGAPAARLRSHRERDDILDLMTPLWAFIEWRSRIRDSARNRCER
jgi:hypothetical protein